MEKCHGMNDYGKQCKIMTDRKKYFNTLLLPVCEYHENTCVLERWSNTFQEDVPLKIIKFFSMFNHCIYMLKMKPVLALIISGELYNIASFYYPAYMLKDVFFDTVLKGTKEIVNCPVCYEESKDTVMTRCGHSFCRECLINWTTEHGTCPMCRELISKHKLK